MWAEICAWVHKKTALRVYSFCFYSMFNLELNLILRGCNRSDMLTGTRLGLYRFYPTKPVCYSLSRLCDVSSFYRLKKQTLDNCSAVVHRLVLMSFF